MSELLLTHDTVPVVTAPAAVANPRFTPGDVARVSIEMTIAAETVGDLYAMYCAAFQALKTRAAVQHLLTQETFEAEMQLPTISKIIAWDHYGRAIGLATLTRNLGTELISETFYAERFPEEYASNQLWYLGFLLVRPDAQRGGVLAQLVRAVVSHVSTAGGVVAFDVCKFNDDTFKFAEICALLARRIRPSSIERIDVHSFYAVTFPALAAPTTTAADHR